jgi:hypothetical protein
MDKVEKLEDGMYESARMAWSPMHNAHANRLRPPSMTFGRPDDRTRVETARSVIDRRGPNTMHAVTARGVELKVFLFVLADSIDC